MRKSGKNEYELANSGHQVVEKIKNEPTGQTNSKEGKEMQKMQTKAVQLRVSQYILNQESFHCNLSVELIGAYWNLLKPIGRYWDQHFLCRGIIEWRY